VRTMITVLIPVEAGNKAIKDGSLPKIMEGFIQKYKPESAYFFAKEGNRSAQFVIDLSDTSDIPSLAEPFFFGLNASISATPVMNADELRRGLEKMSK
jgi:hypothetical protein